jgi:hypothetical protein
MGDAEIAEFIGRWAKSGGAERANYQAFLYELCDVLEVPRPEPTRPDDGENAYVFERAVKFDNGARLSCFQNGGSIRTIDQPARAFL